MSSDRRTAGAVGVLFIVASVTAVLGGSLVLPIEDGLGAVAASQGEIAVGVLLELVLVLSVVGIAVLLYPVLRGQGEGLALGYVAARILEGGLLLAAAMSARVVMGIGINGSTADADVQAGVALAIRDWTYLTGSLLMFGVSAIILYALLYRAKLVPVWLSLWGLIGSVLILARGVLEVGGVELPGAAQGLLTAPVGLNEIVLAIWLILRGFDVRGIGADAGRAHAHAAGPTGSPTTASIRRP